MKYLVLLPIYFYRRCISPLKPPCCRFYPTCSTYAVQAIQRFGAIKGTYLAVRRLLRCHPWNLGGVDYVPERFPGFVHRKPFGALSPRRPDARPEFAPYGTGSKTYPQKGNHTV